MVRGADCVVKEDLSFSINGISCNTQSIQHFPHCSRRAKEEVNRLGLRSPSEVGSTFDFKPRRLSDSATASSSLGFDYKMTPLPTDPYSYNHTFVSFKREEGQRSYHLIDQPAENWVSRGGPGMSILPYVCVDDSAPAFG